MVFAIPFGKIFQPFARRVPRINERGVDEAVQRLVSECDPFTLCFQDKRVAAFF